MYAFHVPFPGRTRPRDLQRGGKRFSNSKAGHPRRGPLRPRHGKAASGSNGPANDMRKASFHQRTILIRINFHENNHG